MMNEPFFGAFGGQFVAETLIPSLDELDVVFKNLQNDEIFNKKLNTLLNTYAGRPTPVYFAENLSREYGFNLYIKREDLLHTGAHKINNTIGQALLAKHMGKTRVIAETGAGQHGVATATAASLLELDCTVYMGEVDAIRQASNVRRMEILGAKVQRVKNGSKTLKEAVSASLRDWVTNIKNTHYIIGSVVGPHPFPYIVAYFQSVIGKEAREYFDAKGFLPDYVVACVGGGSNAMGIFKGFVETKTILIGVEAAGKSKHTGDNAASLNYGEPGVFQGALSYVLQNDEGQIVDAYSISAGLDYPGVGPEHSFFKETHIAQYVTADDISALKGFFVMAKKEGIIPALESSHALGYILDNHKDFLGKTVLLNLSGRGDKDMGIVESAGDLK